jgi:hypothetical protein
VCERVEPKEELLEDVPVRLMVREWRRGLEVMACSESLESEELEDFGGDGSGMWRATRS